jgi:hypothetical protein
MYSVKAPMLNKNGFGLITLIVNEEKTTSVIAIR